MKSYEDLVQEYTSAGQEHVFQYYNELSDYSKEKLIKNLNAIQVDRVNHIFRKATSSTKTHSSVEPLPAASFSSCISNDTSDWYHKGLILVSQNKVAVILLAGGQGTRLGSSDPKGCYDIQLPSHKSLFQLQAERIIRLTQLAQELTSEKVVIPWYVMTSGPTRAPTESFFKDRNYFGLDPANVIFFEQGVLPAFTFDGKIYMESKDTPAVAPDGNGGIYAALRNEGVIADLERRKIPYVHTYCVDNCLVKVGDPVFIGYCVEKNADCAAKVVPKKGADEPVGVICLKDGKFNVVEYSEIDPEMAQAREQGKLVFNAANIANHFYTTTFLKRVNEIEDKLEYHIAKKKITHIHDGAVVKPSSPNGIKLELFIFDVFPFTERMAVLEVAREEEFSPLKNAPGSKEDCPETSRADIMKQHVRFVEAAGGKVAPANEGEIPILEISPLVSYGGENLEKLKGRILVTPKHIQAGADLE